MGTVAEACLKGAVVGRTCGTGATFPRNLRAGRGPFLAQALRACFTACIISQHTVVDAAPERAASSCEAFPHCWPVWWGCPPCKCSTESCSTMQALTLRRCNHVRALQRSCRARPAAGAVGGHAAFQPQQHFNPPRQRSQRPPPPCSTAAAAVTSTTGSTNLWKLQPPSLRWLVVASILPAALLAAGPPRPLAALPGAAGPPPWLVRGQGGLMSVTFASSAMKVGRMA